MTGTDARAIRVVIADDQALLRSSLELILGGAPDIDVVGLAGTGAEAIAQARELAPDVVLMDIRMPGGDGIEATAAIAADEALAATRVLVLSMFELDEYVYGALRAGASGFLLKDAHPDELREAIRRTHQGESLFAPTILGSLIAHFLGAAGTAGATGAAGANGRAGASARGALDRLTSREHEVLVLVARGLSNDEIAAEFTISVKTVKTHIGSLLSKLHARDRAQLVIAAYEGGAVGG
ncbi:LuxR family two component transcriptional regulator [Leucobacter komagatae]|uniref:LuxR family two component transcriptional regulator n=1 Tax=Leucobacter komagatae TaxID=55969 RepID=A0A542Y8U8_9MICO|nr:response regulator transcription factor [Leucobacter komagatae]TQL44505.1 LuxR family two component transcriptional regulator [Leucobacter komagatae]